MLVYLHNSTFTTGSKNESMIAIRNACGLQMVPHRAPLYFRQEFPHPVCYHVTPVIMELGRYWLSSIVYNGEQIRVHVNRLNLISEDQICTVYGADELEDIRAVFARQIEINDKKKRQTQFRPKHRNNRQPMTKTAFILREPDAVLPSADFESLSHIVVPRVGDDGLIGSDIDQQSGNDSDASNAGDPSDMVSLCNSIWHGMAHNIFAKAPQPKHGNANAYVNIPDADRDSLDNSIFEKTNFANIFPKAYIKLAHADDWLTIFDTVFPKLGHKKSVQGLDQCKFRETYKGLLKKLPKEKQDELRAALYTHFKLLKWFPWTTSDKLWRQMDHGSKSKRWMAVPEKIIGAAVQIALNAKHIGLDAIYFRDGVTPPVRNVDTVRNELAESENAYNRFMDRREEEESSD